MARLISSDGQLFDLSEPAAQLSQTLRNTLEDTTGDAPVPVPLGSEALANITKFLERKVALLESLPDERRAELRERGLPRAAALDADPDAVTEAALDALAVDGLSGTARLLCDLRWFDAALPTTILAEHVAQLLRGQTADALRELLGEADDLNADEKRAALAEPLYVQAASPAAAPAVAPEVAPAAAPAPAQPTRSISLAMDDSDPFEGNMRACLERCDARTLRELKAVSVAWWRRAREVLGDPASAWRQRPIWSPSAKGRELAAQLGCEDPTRRWRVLERMRDEKLDPGVDLPGHAWAIVPLLESTDLGDSNTARVHTKAALELLGQLEAAILAQHAAAIIAVLKDRVWDVRRAALRTLGKLEAAVLAQHAAAIITTSLEDRSYDVRKVAVETLGKLDAAALAPHEAALIAKLAVTHAVDPDDDMAHVAHAALEVLAMLGAEKIAQHAAAIAAKLEDSSWLVRVAAVEMLGRLDAAALAQHAAAVVAMLEIKPANHGHEPKVRKAAVETLGRLDATTLAQHEEALAKTYKNDNDPDVRREACLVMHTLKPSAGYDISAKLTHSASEVRVAAVETLGELDAAALAQHAAALVVRLGDGDSDVREAAVKTLGKLEAAALAEHAPAVVAKLKHWNAGARFDVVQVLGKLDAAALAQHAAAVVTSLADSDEDVRGAALEVLSKLGVEQALAQHADTVAAMLVYEAPADLRTKSHTDAAGRRAACLLMHKLKPSAGYDTVAKLNSARVNTRLNAVKTLGKLDAATLAQHEQSLAKVAKNPHEGEVVREAAAQLLAELRGGSGSHQ